MSGKRIPFLLATVFAAASATAQDAPIAQTEEQVWLSMELRWRPIKRWTFTGEFTMRTFGALNEVKGGYYYLTAQRRLNDFLLIDAKIRYVNTPRDDFYRSEIGARVQKRFGKDLLFFRTAYFHEERKLFWAEGMPRIPDNYWRNRIRFNKDLPKRYSAYVSFETWTRFRHDRDELRRVAFMSGIRRDLKRGRRVSLDYLYQPEFAKRAPQHLQAFIVGYSWDVTKTVRRRAPGRAKSEEQRDPDSD